MQSPVWKPARLAAAGLSVAALALTLWVGVPSGASADEADAKGLLKAMSDYMAAQQAISFDYDSVLEVVTKEDQMLALASSGSVTLNRPDKLRITRSGGFADVELLFDGKVLTVQGKVANAYAQIEVPGTVDQLIDVLREKHGLALPAADLMTSDAYSVLIADVTDVKDLGSGIVGGVECDFLAFRSDEVDWQIWIAQGDHPYPCRFAIVSKKVAREPQYSVQVRNWKTGDEVAKDDFQFNNASGATKVDLKDIGSLSGLPEHFKQGAAQ